MKLSSITIFIMGFFLMLAALSFGFFHAWIPNNKEADMWNANRKDLDAVIAQKSKAEKRVKDAKADVNAKVDEWNAIVATNTPPDRLAAGGIDMSVNPQQLVVDTRTFRDEIQRRVNEQVVQGGVKVLDGPIVPRINETDSSDAILAGFFNYPAIPFPVVVLDFGTVRVSGTYDQIIKNIRSYKSMRNYLAVTDGLVIDGTTPNFTATYNLTVVAYIQAKTISSEAKMIVAGSGGTNGAAGGAPAGGPPGGAPGGAPFGAQSGPGKKPGISTSGVG